MIKKTLYFGNPAYLSLKLGQLVVRKPGSNPALLEMEDEQAKKYGDVYKTIPIEDIGMVVLDNRQITITQGLLEALHVNNTAVVTCDSRHLPCGLFLPLEGNTVQNERFRIQIDASLPLKKQLWQQTVAQKIRNQASVLAYSTREIHNNMSVWANDVRSGDSQNMEARAAVYYWKTVFPEYPGFIRNRDEAGPNVLLNYGYGILRAIIARALVSSGMLPTLGIHHHNRYNAYCLADDIMEPYRPYVDKMVVDMIRTNPVGELDQNAKAMMLGIPTLEVVIAGKRSPLMVAASTTTASLYKCFEGESRKILYPEMTL
ncbi:MAG: type II CRISPR-associated endonuclease Cas1 [Bacteroidales bacterium]|nr:type II CRISPR-associated endonuclease Cas1 [Bacteroidales bacterium]